MTDAQNEVALEKIASEINTAHGVKGLPAAAKDDMQTAEAEVVALEKADEPVVAPTAPVSPPVTPIAPATPATRVPMMTQFADYVLVPGGDFEFASMPSSTGVLPGPEWELTPEEQLGLSTSLAGLSLVSGTGAIFQVTNADGAGVGIDTKLGFGIKLPFYWEWGCTFPVTDNHAAIWLLTTRTGDDATIAGEDDAEEGGWGVDAETLHNGPTSAISVYGPDIATAGKHRAGQLVTATEVTTFVNGAQVGSPTAWNEPLPADTVCYPLITNIGAGGNAGTTSPTVVGAAGQLVVSDVEFYQLPA
jgi:hypothetical protein